MYSFLTIDTTLPASDPLRLENNVKVGYKDKKGFNDLNRLITDIRNNKVKKENAIKRLEKSISDLNQLRQEKSTVFQNKMIQVVYQLFNLFGLNKRLFHYSEKKNQIN